jgi:hypothetical protein
MKTLSKLILFAVLLGAFTQCKKGEDDPFISFRSRKARVAGEWKQTSGSYISTSRSSNYSSTTNTTYSGDTYTRLYSYTNGGTSSSNTTSGIYIVKYTFEKDGTLKVDINDDGDVSVISGTWNFSGKIGEHKNKQQIVIALTSYAYDGFTTTYGGNETLITYDIKELRNKKMVLTTNYSRTELDGDLYETTEEIVLEQ